MFGLDDTDTVDGRNPAPVDMVDIPLFTRFHTCQVVQDFFHERYYFHFQVNPFPCFFWFSSRSIMS